MHEVSQDRRLVPSGQHSRWRLSREERQAVAKIGGLVGLLAGVAQFLGSYFHSGLTLLLASVAVVLGGLGLTFVVMRGWLAGQRKVPLSVNAIVLSVLPLVLVGVLGGTIGRSIGIVTRPSPMISSAPAGGMAGPAPAGSLSSAGSPIPTPAREVLSYEISASPAGSRTVRVTTRTSGEAQPEMTYWFILEVDYGKRYSEFYPRRKMTSAPESFDVSIPEGADSQYARNGRIYALNSVESTQAVDKFQRQGATGVNDFFDHAIGQPASNVVRLPF